MLGAATTNHDTDHSVTVVDLGTQTVTMAGATQAISGARQVSFSFNLEDLGPGGSFTLVAKPVNFPSDMQYVMPRAALVKLIDPNSKDWIAFGGSCLSGGLFTGAGFIPTVHSNCALTSSGATPSAYASAEQWSQVQIPTFGGTSTNTFPTCNWANASAGPITVATPQPTPTAIPCAFNNSFFVSNKVPAGTYTATYALVNTYDTSETQSGGIQLTLYKKKNVGVVEPTQQAVDINVILVGNQNINDSRTSAGHQRLDALFESVQDHYSQSNTNVKLGKINVFEWECSRDGDYYADLNYSYDSEDFFRIGSAMVSAYPKSVNLFLVSQIRASSTSSLKILGFAGGIRGSLASGTESNGVAIATFDKLQTIDVNSRDFFNLSSTISHEMGHFFGLNHPQESGGTSSVSMPKTDPIPDTPFCGMTLMGSTNKYYVQHSSCLNSSPLGSGSAFSVTGCSAQCPGYSFSTGASTFCPTATECQFNHVMWWTTQNYDSALQTGDGTLFSTQSSKVLRFHPYIY